MNRTPRKKVEGQTKFIVELRKFESRPGGIKKKGGKREEEEEGEVY